MKRIIKPNNIKFVFPQLLIRGTSKIAVDLDAEILAKLENEEIKPRNHPGILKSNNQLPIQINKALHRVIGDYPIKTILKDCRELDKYIAARHPPAERDDVNERMKKIIAEVDERMPQEQLAQLSDDDREKWWRKRENAIQRILGQRTYAWKPITYGAYEAVVYAIGRGPREYGVLLHIFDEISTRDPQFQPRSYFDFGSGVGTGMWAANHTWTDSIYEYYNVDSSREMNDLSELILREGNENQQIMLRNVYYRQFLPATDTKYDLIVSSFSLFELPSAENRKEVVLNLWRKCNGYLIIVEEGTRKGSELVNEAREYLLGLEEEHLKGQVFAPCPHDSVCPRLTNEKDRTPCNFEISYTPLRVGNVHKDRLSTRYSYVVMKKGVLNEPTRNWPRIVRPTLVRSKHAICRMCTADAKLQEIIFTQSKHGKVAYRCAKVTRWGDRFPAAAIGVPYKTEKKFTNKKENTNNESDTVNEIEEDNVNSHTKVSH